MKKNRLLAFVFSVLSSSVSFGCEEGIDPAVELAGKLKLAINKSDTKFVEGLLPDGDILHPDIERFIFGDREQGKKSIADIVGNKESSIKVRKISDWTEAKRDIYQIFFVIKNEKSDPSFERLAELFWMRDYAACLFEKKGKAWKAVNTFCYAETEGPFYMDVEP